jgi:hypothetical protein
MQHLCEKYEMTGFNVIDARFDCRSESRARNIDLAREILRNDRRLWPQTMRPMAV